MNRKYELTDKFINLGCHTLHEIRALRDFRDVKAGDLGGFIESELIKYIFSCISINFRVYSSKLIKS